MCFADRLAGIAAGDRADDRAAPMAVLMGPATLPVRAPAAIAAPTKVACRTARSRTDADTRRMRLVRR